jgi:hypothetical protein
VHNLVFLPLVNRALGKGGLAQLVERLLCKQNVNGSNPLTSTSFNWAHPWKQGPVAQLVRAPP